MAIYLYCPTCYTTFPTRAKACPKCKSPVPRTDRKYRVIVNYKGRTKTGLAPSLSLADELETSYKSELFQMKALGKSDEDLLPIPKLSEIWSRYIADAPANKVKSWKRDRDRYEQHIGPVFGNYTLDRITADRIEKLKSRLLEATSRRGIPYAPATVWNILELLRRLFNYAARLSLFTKDNPFESKRVKFPRVDNAVDAALNPEALRKFLRACDSFKDDPVFGAMCRFLVNTACRRGEAIKLTWDDIDLENRRARLVDTKAGKTQHVPLNDGAITVLQSLGKQRTGDHKLVFPALSGKMRTNTDKPWKALKRIAKLPDNLRLHDLRHTFATVLASSGQVDALTLQTLMRHSDPRMTARYSHHFPGALQKAAGVLDEITRHRDEDSGQIVNLNDERRRRKA